MPPLRRLAALLALLWAGASPLVRGQEPPTGRATRNVVLVTTDGLRPEEVFTGAEEALMDKADGGVENVDALRAAFWRDTPEARRRALLPFLWGVVAERGQLYGNTSRGCSAVVTNGKNFSYPGYNEMLSGAPDPAIDSNDKRPNPNVTVLGWLDGEPEFRGKVAAFGSWDVFPFILNRNRDGLLVNAGWEPVGGADPSPLEAILNRLTRDVPHAWPSVRYDAMTFEAALEHLRGHRPRVLYLALGETDEYAHGGRYDRYLQAALRVDSYLKRLWEALQELPEYRDATTLIVTTDHGRGSGPRAWRDHGAKVPGSERIWVGLLGPDTPALGERTDTDPITQAQVASTLAALLGKDYLARNPKAAPPIAEAIRSRRP